MKKILIVWMTFWQQVSQFVFNVSNLLFPQVSTIQTQTSSGNVESLQLQLDRLCATHFLTLLHPSLGFDPYFGKVWARSTDQFTKFLVTRLVMKRLKFVDKLCPVDRFHKK